MVLSRARAIAAVGIWSLAVLPTLAQAPPAPFIGRNFEAIDSRRTADIGGTLFEPPDTNGAVGLRHYVQLNNGSFTVFQKDGTQVQQMNAGAFFTAAGVSVTSANSTDPRLLYDRVNQRWVACVISTEPVNNRVIVARSSTNNPTGPWRAVSFTANTITETGGADPNRFADFPTMGMTNQNVAIATINFNPTGTVSLYSLPKADLYLDTPSTANLSSFDRTAAAVGFLISPTVNYGAASGPNMPVLSNLSSGGSTLRRTTLSGVGAPGATFSVSSTQIAVNSYGIPPNAQQPGSGINLDTGDNRIGSSSLHQGNLIYSVFATSFSNRSALRFTVINETNNGVVFQTTLSEANADYFYPSVAVNTAGDVVIGFGITRTGGSPLFGGGAVITGATADFATWNFNTATVLVSGTAVYTGGRWGDYSATTPDPADPGIFWTTQEFQKPDTALNWATQASEVILPKTGEVRWLTTTNGTYTTAANWFGGVAPAATDHVIVSRQSAGNYTVTLPTANTTADRLSVRQGPVTISIPSGFSFTLTNAGSATPALSVVEFAGDGSLTVTGGGTLNSPNALVAGEVGGLGALTVTGAGTVWNNAANVDVGGTAAAAGGTGTLTVQAGATATVGGTLTLRRTDAAVNVSGGSTLAVASLTNAAGTTPAVTIGTGSTLQITAGNAATYSGVLTGPGQFDKNGTGTFSLAGVNTHTGNTVVNAGTLALSGSGSLANSPTLHVGAGATFDVTGVTGGANFDGTRFRLAANQSLRGVGTVQGSVAVAATSSIAPGTPATPGTLTVNGDLVFGATGVFVAKLNGTTPGTGHDQVQVNGTVTLVSAGLNASLGGAFSPTGTDRLYVLVKSGSDPIIGQFNNLPEGATVSLGTQFQASISYIGDFVSGSLTGGNDVVLYNFGTPVPEPGTILGLSAVCLLVARVVRRRRSVTVPNPAA